MRRTSHTMRARVRKTYSKTWPVTQRRPLTRSTTTVNKLGAQLRKGRPTRAAFFAIMSRWSFDRWRRHVARRWCDRWRRLLDRWRHFGRLARLGFGRLGRIAGRLRLAWLLREIRHLR